MGLVKLALADAGLTFLWVLLTGPLGAVVDWLARPLGLSANSSVFLVAFIIFVLITIFSAVGQQLGGASWNPTSLLAFWTLGLSKLTLLDFAVRFPAQAVGAAGGALAAREFTPHYYQHYLGGPELKVDLHTGAAVEAGLTFLMTLAVLGAVLKGPKSDHGKTALIVVATIVLVGLGQAYTGPAMNPANAFAWAFLRSGHLDWEHYYVYWLTPLFATWLASSFFGLLYKPAAGRKEKAA